MEAARHGASADRLQPWPRTLREFEALIDRLQDRLVQFAFCRLRSQEDAEDVVQDVLVQAYRDREKHKHVDNADPFLFRMVANRCTDLLRKRRRERAAGSGVAPQGRGGPTGDAGRWIEGLLDRLPRRQAEVIRLRVYGELPFETVAQAVGSSVPTVKSRFRYGLQKLRKEMER